MRIVKIVLLVAATYAALISQPALADSYGDIRGDIVLRCSATCDFDEMVKGYVRNRNEMFAHGEQRIVVKPMDGDQELYSITIREFMESHAVEEVTQKLDLNETRYGYTELVKILDRNSTQGFGERKSGMDFSTSDAALSCEYDNDFSCADWGENAYLHELAWYIENHEIKFIVTPEFYYGHTNGQADMIVLMVGILSAVPAGRLGALLARYTMEEIAEELGQIYAAAITGVALFNMSDAIAEMIRENWGVEIGDTIVINTKEWRIIKSGDPGSLDYTGGSTSGGSGGEDNATGGSSGGGSSGGGTFGGTRCKIVYTGPKDDTTMQVVCYH